MKQESDRTPVSVVGLQDGACVTTWADMNTNVVYFQAFARGPTPLGGPREAMVANPSVQYASHHLTKYGDDPNTFVLAWMIQDQALFMLQRFKLTSVSPVHPFRSGTLG